MTMHNQTETPSQNNGRPEPSQPEAGGIQRRRLEGRMRSLRRWIITAGFVGTAAFSILAGAHTASSTTSASTSTATTTEQVSSTTATSSIFAGQGSVTLAPRSSSSGTSASTQITTATS